MKTKTYQVAYVFLGELIVEKHLTSKQEVKDYIGSILRDENSSIQVLELTTEDITKEFGA